MKLDKIIIYKEFHVFNRAFLISVTFICRLMHLIVQNSEG